jgi:hypothetical protein
MPSNLIARVDAAAVGAADAHSIAERLRVTEAERGSAPGHLQAAFEYAEASPGPDPVGVGSYFGPMMEIGDRRCPPALDALPDDMAAVWQEAAAVVTAPLAVARLNDLCFEAGLGDRGTRARRAIEAYLAASDELVDPADDSGDRHLFTRLTALSRARQLARTVGDGELEARAVEETARAAETFLDANDGRSALPFLRLLVNDAQHVGKTNELLNRAKETLAGDAVGLEDAVRTQLQLGGFDETTRMELRRELVNAIASQADLMEGIARAHHLERGISEAGDAGLHEMVDELTLRMQALSSTGELDLAAQEFGFTISREQVEPWFDLYLSAPDWQDALLRLTEYPPSGNVEENRVKAEALAREHPLVWLVTRVRVGGDGLPRFTPANDEELRDYQLTEYEMRGAQLGAVFFPELFGRIWKK